MPQPRPESAFNSIGIGVLLVFTLALGAARVSATGFSGEAPDETRDSSASHAVADPCPEGAIRIEGGVCLFPPREVLTATVKCEEGHLAYAGQCWPISKRTAEQTLEAYEGDAISAEGGCPSLHASIRGQCVPLVKNPTEYRDRLAQGERFQCRRNCPEGTVCLRGECIGPIRVQRQDTCPGGYDGVTESGEMVGCKACYRGVWYSACNENPDSCLPSCDSNDPQGWECTCCNETIGT